MSAIPFPTSPTPSQVFTYLGRSWRWDNVRGVWEGITGVGGSLPENLVVRNPTVQLLIPVTGETLQMASLTDDTMVMQPAGELEEIIFNFPEADSCRVGQSITLVSTENVATVNFGVTTGDYVFIGDQLSSLVAGASYKFQCVSVDFELPSQTWIRLV